MFPHEWALVYHGIDCVYTIQQWGLYWHLYIVTRTVTLDAKLKKARMSNADAPSLKKLWMLKIKKLKQKFRV